MIYLVAYLWVIDAQNGAIAWWYVGLMVLAALSFTVAALGTAARAALTVGLVTSALAMLVAVLSLGALLAPTFVAAAIALMATRPGAHTRAAPDEPQPSQQRGGCPLAGRLARLAPETLRARLDGQGRKVRAFGVPPHELLAVSCPSAFGLQRQRVVVAVDRRDLGGGLQ